eukprot:NODE_636_length_1480_cov_71.000000_g473_i0.p1 GENE.NODE_636_length_1480_cov_71.000000_g473_i0~~NODE_636_length_1480_cov_71.000000_g473_i0.p1  ORF type:complete len:293 (-),score=63.79 NODE_636_length_1480_cov_71.000000_g473_i0:547-1425(-)
MQDLSGLQQKIDLWERLLTSTLEKESFGHVLEATESYQTLVTQLGAELKEKQVTSLSGDERACIIKLQQVCNARALMLKSTNALRFSVTLEDMQLLKKDFPKLFNGLPFPISTTSLPVLQQPAREDDDATLFTDNGGKLHPCPTKLVPGDRILKIHIKEVGLKDAMTYLEPSICVSVRDGSGSLLSNGEQETPHPVGRRTDTSIPFDATVFISTPINKLPEDAGIFFEFRHYKPKKKKVSTRCWSLLTMDEVKEGAATLEIYAKPADYKRKKFVHHSVKQLYLHVQLSFIKG